MICLNPSRIYFHYKGKGLYVVKNVFCTGMGGGTHEHAADWDTGGGRSSAGTSKAGNRNMASISVSLLAC